MLKSYIAMLLIIGIAIGSISSQLEGTEKLMYNDIVHNITEDFKQEEGLVGGMILGVWVISDTFARMGHGFINVLIGIFGIDYAVIVAIVLVFVWLLWYPITWLLCMFGILIKDRLNKGQQKVAGGI